LSEANCGYNTVFAIPIPHGVTDVYLINIMQNERTA